MLTISYPYLFIFLLFVLSAYSFLFFRFSGLEHYRQFGYKCRLKPPNSIFDNMRDDSNWITVKYNHNRGILHDGDFPHLSTKVLYLPRKDAESTGSSSDSSSDNSSSSCCNSNNSSSSSNSSNSGGEYAGLPIRRVILGFNCFSEIVKSCCERAPEV